MDGSSVFRKNRAARDRKRPYRPVLECLEDRFLLSSGFAQVNLASDLPGLARVTDPHLVNPWGAAFSPTGPFWLAENSSGVSDLLDGRGNRLPLVVTVPSAGGLGSTPTGAVFNGGPGFAIAANGVLAPSRFLFATQDGTISGWASLVDPARSFVVVDSSSSGADFTGLALAADPTGSTFLYAADFSHGTIDVFNQDFQAVVRPGSFQDPNLPDGYAPFNVQNIHNLLFVTYAQQDGDRHDDVPGAGHGFIDVFTPDGSLIRRFASGGALSSPWGLALAPADFGPFGGALLVGNNGDGRVNAYDSTSGAFLGQLGDNNGNPITIPNLWALTFGNGHAGGDAHTLFFAAGVDYDEHGLFGAIQRPGHQGADTGGTGGFDPSAPGEPGDYPLPPSGGPAFRVSNDNLFMPTSDLLPLQDGSLVLGPTLSANAPATPARAIPNGADATAPSGPQSPPVWGGHGNTVALSTFLDVSASSTIADKQAGLQRPDPNQSSGGGGSFVVAARDTGAEDLGSFANVEIRVAQPNEEQGPAALSGTTTAGLTPGALEAGPESGVEPTRGDESLKSHHRRSWTEWMNILFVVTVPMIWACWAGLQPRFRQLDR
jgi:uncharacterized protein (TIGR03118 family)